MKPEDLFTKISTFLRTSRWSTFLFPLLFYFVSFCLLTYPLIFKFSTHIFADMGDGLQNYWNLWWVNKAITQLHQNPWFTNFLHYPTGVTLIGHTLNIFNGLIGTALQTFLSLTQTYNVVVIFSFVMSGFTAFLLSHTLTNKYFPSLAAGFAFTFSEFHFAHAQGHMQLISMEWVPLFVLCWYLFLHKPTPKKAIASAIVLLLVLLCDYYYFFYCVLTGSLMFMWSLREHDYLFFLERKNINAAAVFFISATILIVPIVGQLYLQNLKSPFLGAHPSGEFSADLVSAFIPGEHWRFSNLTEGYWKLLPGNGVETSVYLGWSVLLVAVYSNFYRKKGHASTIILFSVLSIIFYFLSLGEQLHILKNAYSIPMPYSLLTWFFPILSLSGMPVRMMMMVTLFLSVLFAFGLRYLAEKKYRNLIIGVVVIGLVVEVLPSEVPASSVDVPEFVQILKDAPDGGVVDWVSTAEESLLYQTIYEKPLAFGYISRIPADVVERDDLLLQSLLDHDFTTVTNTYKIKYLLTNEDLIAYRCKLLYKETSKSLYDISSCQK